MGRRPAASPGAGARCKRRTQAPDLLSPTVTQSLCDSNDINIPSALRAEHVLESVCQGGGPRHGPRRPVREQRHHGPCFRPTTLEGASGAVRGFQGVLSLRVTDPNLSDPSRWAPSVRKRKEGGWAEAPPSSSYVQAPPRVLKLRWDMVIHVCH